MLAVLLGTAAMTAVASLEVSVVDRVGRELRSFGANITVTPAADGLPVSIGGVDYRPVSAGEYLEQDRLTSLKKIFWRHNIVSFAPFLYVPASIRGTETVLIGTWFDKKLKIDEEEVFSTGLDRLHPAWAVEGAWPREDAQLPECLLGRRLARELGLGAGEPLEVELTGGSGAVVLMNIAGILETGGHEDGQVFAPLASVQFATGLEGKFRRLEISALTKPEDEFAGVDLETLSAEEFDRWYCTPYVSSIAYQIEEVLPGAKARPVYRITETEGRILGQVDALLWALAVAALVTAILAVSSTALATLLERRPEIGLMKAVGAGQIHVAKIFLLEAMLSGLGAGLLGFFAGALLVAFLGRAIFGSSMPVQWILLPGMLTVAVAVSLVGHAWPLWWARRFLPTEILHDPQGA